MVSRLKQAGIIQSDAVAAVMEAVDRRHYVPDETVAYQDTPLSIGLGQTISAPHMHAHVLQEIYPYVQNKPNVKFLDVGCGSGYLTACFARWIQPKPTTITPGGKTTTTTTTTTTSFLGATSGRVYGIDIHKHLVDMTKINMQKADGDLLDITVLSTTNGWHGLPDAAPFDAIHVGAAAAEFPQELATQLKKDGVLIVPVGPQYAAQSLIKVQRIDDRHGNQFDASEYKFTELLGVRYVPLVDTNPPTS
jgi:protein-L-isoaspartate(D-aspartate) O-methyltransferase